MARLALCATVIAAMVWSPHAFAVDGVIEINQASAEEGGVSPGDLPGMPVSLGPGSYRLTGNLEITDNLSRNAIEVTGENVTIDLNGFAISCRNLGTDCSAFAGVGNGIAVTGAAGLRIANGSIRGFASDGVEIQSSYGVELVWLRVHGNGQHGLSVAGTSSARVESSMMLANGGDGIQHAASGRLLVKDILTRDNLGVGVDAPVGGIFAHAAHSNFNDGISGSVTPLGCSLDGTTNVCPP